MIGRKPNPARNAVFDEALRHHRAGRLDQALAGYVSVLRLQPAHLSALSNGGSILRHKGRHAEALKYLQRALQVAPEDGPAWINYCNVLIELGRKTEAVEAGRKAIRHAPKDAFAYNNLGRALFQVNQFDESRQHLERSLELNPVNVTALINLGNVNQRQCRVNDSIACYRKVLELDPANEMAHSNLLFTLHFSPDYSVEQLHAAHLEWAARHEQPIAGKALPPATPDPARQRLRVGMLSPDLSEHPVMRFLQPLVIHWPAQQFDLCFYYTGTAPDGMTNWLKTKASGWRDVAGLGDRQLAETIRADQIDILIDLSGHTGLNRLKVFAYRPAPVQATWLGYFDTTGMASMDYLIADPLCVPPGDDARYSERVVRLPQDFVCYMPPEGTPPVAPSPVQSGQPFTFGSLNQIVKLSDPTVELWSRILQAAPGTRLFLGGKSFNDESTRRRYQDRFAAHGVDPGRLILQGGVSPQELLKSYARMDLALDPLPCAGGTTTCEALWMGVPVLSLYGERFCGRHSASHLHAAGLPEFVHYSAQSFVDAAVAYSRDPSRLVSLRDRLRQTVQQSALCDGAGYAAHFGRALQSMWQDRAQSRPRATPG